MAFEGCNDGDDVGDDAGDDVGDNAGDDAGDDVDFHLSGGGSSSLVQPISQALHLASQVGPGLRDVEILTAVSE